LPQQRSLFLLPLSTTVVLPASWDSDWLVAVDFVNVIYIVYKVNSRQPTNVC
jgi:hypothetical protein